VAVEPGHVADRLRLLVAANGLTERVQVIQKCVSTSNAESMFYDDGGAISSLSLEWTRSRGNNIRASVVPCITLDEIVRQIRASEPSAAIVCKCDIEGHEEQVFETFAGLTDRDIHFCVEVHNCADVERSTVYRKAVESGRVVTNLDRCWAPHSTVLF
jgi:FkbM family methyltransferase